MSPHRLIPHAVHLELGAQEAVKGDLSGAAFSGEWLWIVGDETSAVALMRRVDPVGGAELGFALEAVFELDDLIDLPGQRDDEADLEGLAVVGDWLWLAGSHGHKRKKPKPEFSEEKNVARLARLDLDGNRRLLARIPIERVGDTPRLVQQAQDGRRAARLESEGEHNALTALLADDPHVGAFVPIPGKDNGLDVEGLAAFGDRLLPGLRGPVLRGFAMLLEIEPRVQGDVLRLAPLDASGSRLRKHFVDLGGLGVRDLHFDGDDLVVLAGPTMVLDGAIRVFVWPDARESLARAGGPAGFAPPFIEGPSLPHGHGSDRAEALCALPPSLGAGWLVLYDAPGPARHAAGPTAVYGDLLR